MPRRAVSVLRAKKLFEVRPRREHQDQAEKHSAETEPEWQRDAEDRFGFDVRRFPVEDRRLDQHPEQHHPAQQRDNAQQEERPDAFEELMAEEPDAREAGEPVVEADRKAERRDRVHEHAFGEQQQRHGHENRQHSHRNRRDVGRQIRFVDFAEHSVHGFPVSHRQRRPRRWEDRRLRGCRRRGQHADDQRLGQDPADGASAEHGFPERVENVFGVRFVGQEADAVKRLGARGDEQVDDEQQHRRDHRGLAGAVGGILGLLVDGDARIPAPVDEHPEQDPVEQVAEVDGERVEPVGGGLDRAVRGAAAVDL